MWPYQNRRTTHDKDPAVIDAIVIFDLPRLVLLGHTSSLNLLKLGIGQPDADDPRPEGPDENTLEQTLILRVDVPVIQILISPRSSTRWIDQPDLC
jgi:hypothetical protein